MREVNRVRIMLGLSQEKADEWARCLGPGGLGLTLATLTSDTDLEGQARLPQADIILTTPENFDSATRRGTGKHKAEYKEDQSPGGGGAPGKEAAREQGGWPGKEWTK